MNREKHPWIYDVLFLLVFLLAGYLRLTGANWGEGQNQHPDENFLSGVLGSLQSQKCADANLAIEACPDDQRRWISILDYFNSKTSPLNPYNHGYTSYVYGDLPLTIVRVAADAIHENDVKMLGRQFSGLADLFAILFLYLIVSRLYGRKVALLASLFSALAVMQIQQSHFFTVDLFVNTFEFLAIYFVVAILDARYVGMEQKELLETELQELEIVKAESTEVVDTEAVSIEATNPSNEPQFKEYLSRFIREPFFLLSIGFGLAFGMSLASKINIAPLAILLPSAFVLRYFINKKENKPLGREYWLLVITCLIAGGIASFISFRIFQPYAFDGLLPSQQWIANIKEQRVQAVGDADLPWNLQWVRRSHLYSFENLTIWGLGLPLGILAWLGFLYMGWRIIKGDWRHALLWGWTAFYFGWQSLQFNPTMRYQLPIYPLLAMMAAWFVFELARLNVPTVKRLNIPKILAVVLGVTVVILTAIWAFAFQSIYTRDEPRMAASRWIFQNIAGPINVEIQRDGTVYNQPLPFPAGGFVQAGQPYDTAFTAQNDGTVDSIKLAHATNTLASSSTLSLILSNTPSPAPDQALATASVTNAFAIDKDSRGDSYVLKLDKPVSVVKGEVYYLRFNIDLGSLTIAGDTLANETDYDYGLPFRVDGYDGFGGIYRGDLNLQVYWDDNADKLDRFISTLDQTDYILIPTNHQYAQISRVPERYPLTAYYYRELMGCPANEETIPCYYNAKPGDYKGRLGYDLVAVFETFPKLGPIEINDQYAEEAFTFYDHPKVFIFKKSANFDINQVKASLGTVDLSKAVHLTPRQFSDYSDLLLPANRLAQQQAGGTWSDLFNYEWIQNKYPALGLVIWYVFIFILGLAVYPLARLTMPGLADKGYPLSRALGLVLFAYIAWMGGSVGIPYTRTNIAIALLLVFIIGAALAYYQRDELREEWKTKRKYFLMVEGLFLALFLVDLLIRIGNPDLWHPAKGGERPMDFSYLNAVIKSTSFPPYDPWFAGGYINYYYYGFVIVGTPVKLLGIVPSIAYNFILPTLFAVVGVSAFSIGWNLLAKDEADSKATDSSPLAIHPSAFFAGLSASALTILLGNLGTLRLIYLRLEQLGLGSITWNETLGERLYGVFKGLTMVFQGVPLPISAGDWYWDPSRVVPPRGGNEITEFPLFTFIYSDLHAHMIVILLALLAVAWGLAVVLGKAKWKNQLSAGLGFVVGGLIIGAVYPTNLSDTYTYLLIGLIAVGYSVWRYADADTLLKRIALTVGAVIALFLLSHFMYEPYRAWYGQAYSALEPWKGPFTPLSSYFTQWGLFLFIIVSWMAWETREWMATTPISALQKLKPYQLIIEGFLLMVVFAMFAFQFVNVFSSDPSGTTVQYIGTSIGWIALPIATWAGILLLRPNLSDTKRWVLFLIGTALLITALVEVVVVRGDIGRQNTIFKFYMQAWLLFAIASGAALAWTVPAFFKWLPGWRVSWQISMILLLSIAMLYPVTAINGKIKDRWIVEAPHTLDSMTFMKYAQYDDFGQRLDLSEDYRAIRWMQDNIKGSPVLVEANCVEYHWCTRFTIYTGLPGVVGWNWHQRQQRVYNSTWVEDRVAAVGDFYNTVDAEAARAFVKKYNVHYIIVGQLERAEYTPEGIAKFDQFDGQLWKSIYHNGNTVIYQVMP